MATCVSLAVSVALSLVAPAQGPPEVPPSPVASPVAPPVDQADVLSPDEVVPPHVAPPFEPRPGTTPATDPSLAKSPGDVSLGAGWEGSEPVVIPRDAGARVAISPDDVALWTPPPTWAPPPLATDRDEGSERWRTIHLGLAIGVVGILTAVGIGLSLSQDPDPFDDGRLAPAHQDDAFFPR